MKNYEQETSKLSPKKNRIAFQKKIRPQLIIENGTDSIIMMCNNVCHSIDYVIY